MTSHSFESEIIVSCYFYGTPAFHLITFSSTNLHSRHYSSCPPVTHNKITNQTTSDNYHQKTNKKHIYFFQYQNSLLTIALSAQGLMLISKQFKQNHSFPYKYT